MPSVVLAALFGFPKALFYCWVWSIVQGRRRPKATSFFPVFHDSLSLFLSAKPIKLLQIRTLIPGFFFLDLVCTLLRKMHCKDFVGITGCFSLSSASQRLVDLISYGLNGRSIKKMKFISFFCTIDL